eukprot:TRINITY_DN4771_c0_g1_i2.p1 TRINITY_DN4771_c0_g1~~TRINITY_DN4771_c0_g1_i2.p1  ORF type:complete len:300 (+),score=44.45 TRINITY_DN4771_c0_g1_i2:23-922(+)
MVCRLRTNYTHCGTIGLTRFLLLSAWLVVWFSCCIVPTLADRHHIRIVHFLDPSLPASPSVASESEDSLADSESPVESPEATISPSPSPSPLLSAHESPSPLPSSPPSEEHVSPSPSVLSTTPVVVSETEASTSPVPPLADAIRSEHSDSKHKDETQYIFGRPRRPLHYHRTAPPLPSLPPPLLSTQPLVNDRIFQSPPPTTSPVDYVCVDSECDSSTAITPTPTPTPTTDVTASEPIQTSTQSEVTDTDFGSKAPTSTPTPIPTIITIPPNAYNFKKRWKPTPTPTPKIVHSMKITNW